MALSPLQIALLIVAAVAAVGVLVTFVRTRMTFTGYQDISSEAQRLGTWLHAELFRDGGDVVVSGKWNGVPVVVRFSNEENTPGLNIRMPASATFVMSVVPAGTESGEGGRVAVKTADELFDTRFTTRTDQPTQARMFLTRQSTALLQRLACSRNTYISFAKGGIELSELVIPGFQPAQHILEHVKTMSELAASLRQMPGAELVKPVKLEHDRHVLARVAMGVGALVALASVFAAVEMPNKPVLTGANETIGNGILPADAAVISDAPRWHAATSEEMDGSAAAWLRSNGMRASGRVQGDFGGSGTGQDVAYLLVSGNGPRRVVIIADHQNRYDVAFPYVGLLARIPNAAVASIRWKDRERPPEAFTGDPVLLVRNRDDGASGLIVFLTPHGPVSASPANYQEINLQ